MPVISVPPSTVPAEIVPVFIAGPDPKNPLRDLTGPLNVDLAILSS
jgi:hypothetical protein